MTHALIPDFSVPLPSAARTRTVEILPAVSLYEYSALVIPSDELAPGSIEPWEAVTAVRPDTPHHRALRVMDALGELVVGLVLVGGGVVLTDLSTLV